MAKILIIGFEASNHIAYPHLQAVLNLLRQDAEVGYFHFRERGYFLADDLKLTLSNLLRFRAVRVLFRFIADSIRLRIVAKNFDCLVAIDNFSYLVACRCHHRTVLWSHDFVSADQSRSKTFIQRWIASHTHRYLSINKKLMIQDAERAAEFFTSIGLCQNIDIYYLAVSLPELPDSLKSWLSNQPECRRRPVLMQIGGINVDRSGSDLLIHAYQSQSMKYCLILHGYFAPDVLSLLLKMQIMPVCSMLEARPEAVIHLVATCDIGLVSYRSIDRNFFLISHASGQLAEFLRCGKPVIVLGNTNLASFVEKCGIGKSVSNLDRLPDAVDEIMTNYGDFSSRCRRLYLNEYCLDSHSRVLARWLFDCESGGRYIE